MQVGWVSALVAIAGAVVAAVSVVVTVVEGRRVRRNTAFSVHRDLWWQRWSWVVERALSSDPDRRRAAALMTHALMTRPWVTTDDQWVEEQLAAHEEATARGKRAREEHEGDLGRRRS